MPSNAGSREASVTSIGFNEDQNASSSGRMKSAVERVFSPEFRNRLDTIVNFGPLPPAVMQTIVEKFIIQLEAQLAEQRVAISLGSDARKWLAEKGYDAQMGARPMSRIIQEKIKRPLAEELLFGELSGGGHITITVEKEELIVKIEETVQ